MSRKAIQISWTRNEEYNMWEAKVPAVDYHGILGYYYITLEQRPPYCDRGKWKVLVSGIHVDELDAAEAFPRYYFDFDVAKSEMTQWVNWREACLNVLKLAKEPNAGV